MNGINQVLAFAFLILAVSSFSFSQRAWEESPNYGIARRKPPVGQLSKIVQKMYKVYNYAKKIYEVVTWLVRECENEVSHNQACDEKNCCSDAEDTICQECCPWSTNDFSSPALDNATLPYDPSNSTMVSMITPVGPAPAPTCSPTKQSSSTMLKPLFSTFSMASLLHVCSYVYVL